MGIVRLLLARLVGIALLPAGSFLLARLVWIALLSAGTFLLARLVWIALLSAGSLLLAGGCFFLLLVVSIFADRFDGVALLGFGIDALLFAGLLLGGITLLARVIGIRPIGILVRLPFVRLFWLIALVWIALLRIFSRLARLVLRGVLVGVGIGILVRLVGLLCARVSRLRPFVGLPLRLDDVDPLRFGLGAARAGLLVVFGLDPVLDLIARLKLELGRFERADALELSLPRRLGVRLVNQQRQRQSRAVVFGSNHDVAQADIVILIGVP